MLRRQALKTSLAIIPTIGIGTLVGSASVSAAQSTALLETTELREKLARALRATANDGCIAAAIRLEDSNVNEGVVLHLRGLNLTASDVEPIADALRALTDAEGSLLASLSLSYNDAIGDAGALSLANALPRSLPELGLVGCKIGDPGGRALLDWARQATRLTMLCVEGNEFSGEVRNQLRNLARENATLSVFA